MKTAEIEKLFREGGALSSLLPNYRPRPGQIALAKLVTDSVLDERHLLCEAPTGTGKSMAFGIPTAIWAVETCNQVVVVTSNIALQEQLIQKDLPVMAQVVQQHLQDGQDRTLRFGLMKGMGNYICPAQIEWSIEELRQTGKKVPGWLQDLHHAVDPSFEGDRNKCGVMYQDDQWAMIGATSRNCTKKDCPYFEQLCPWHRARQGLGRCHVIVTNYHYFYSDIMVRNATGDYVSLLPDHQVVVFDEAHDAPFIAMDFLGFQLPLPRILGLSGHVKRLGSATIQHHDVADAVKKSAQQFYREIPGCLAPTFDRRGRKTGTSNILVKPLQLNSGIRLAQGLEELAEIFGKEARVFEDGGQENVAQATRWLGLAKQVEEVQSIIERVNIQDYQDDEVLYVEQGQKGGNATICGKVVGVGSYFQKNVFSTRTVVAVSATLTAADSFDFVAEKFGLGPDDYISVMTPSPFDPGRIMVVVPRDIPAPTEQGFTVAVAEAIRSAVRHFGGRTMALFTSYANLWAVTGRLRHDLPDMQLLVQNEMPKMKIIEEMKQNPDKSIILATSSFWQGIDIPGQSLSCVVIDKIPFVRIDDPVLHHYEKTTGSGFLNYSVPHATILLKQGVGRLIRTETDYGVVMVLDRRIWTMGYGEDFFRSFPRDCDLSDSIDDIRGFLLEFHHDNSRRDPAEAEGGPATPGPAVGHSPDPA